MRRLVFIKLGGSLITNKSEPYKARIDIINQLATDLKSVIKTSKNTHFIVGNGAGSYGHYAAMTFDKNSPFGYSFIQQKVKELNLLITSALLKEKIPCSSIHMSSIAVANNGAVDSIYMDSVREALSMGIIPSIYGDVILDKRLKACIFSTEDIFSHLIYRLQNIYTKIMVVHLTTVAGFMDDEGNVIDTVTQNSYRSLKKNLMNTKGYDVTGGMRHKIEQSLNLAKSGIITYIASGNDPQILQKILLQKVHVGTKIF